MMRVGKGALLKRLSPALPCGVLIGLFLSGCDPNQTLFSGGRATPTPTPLLHTIEGRIALENRSRHSGAQVFLGGTSHVSLTDTEGRYTLGGVPPGSYELLAEKNGFEELLIDKIELPRTGDPQVIVQPEQTLKAVAAPAAPAQIALEAPVLAARPTELDGKVTLENQTSHEGVLVRIIETGDAVETDSGGEYYFPNLEPGVFKVEYKMDGYQRVEATVVVKREAHNRAETLTLNALGGATADRVVTGQIIMSDRDGNPRADFNLVEVSIAAHNRTASLAPDGSFRFEGLPAVALMVSAAAEGYDLDQPAVVDLTMTDLANVTLEFVAAAEGLDFTTGDIVGQVVRMDVEGSQSGIAVALAGTQFSAMTSPSGDFQFLDVPAGTYFFYAEAEGFDPIEFDGLEVEPGTTLDLGELVLERNIEPPRVVRAVPDDGAKDVEVLERLRVLFQFSKPMDAGSVKDAFSIKPEVDYQIFFGREHAQSDDRSLIVELLGASPDMYVKFGEQYTLEIAKEVVDLDGIAMEKDFTLKFRTAGPAVIRSDPSDGAKRVRLGNARGLVFYLNDQIKASSFDKRDIRVRPDLKSEIWFEHYSDPYSGWTQIKVYGHWEQDTQYTVTLGNRFENMDGKKFANTPYSVTFRTTKWEPILPLLQGRERLRPNR